MTNESADTPGILSAMDERPTCPACGKATLERFGPILACPACGEPIRSMAKRPA